MRIQIQSVSYYGWTPGVPRAWQDLTKDPTSSRGLGRSWTTRADAAGTILPMRLATEADSGARHGSFSGQNDPHELTLAGALTHFEPPNQETFHTWRHSCESPIAVAAGKT